MQPQRKYQRVFLSNNPGPPWTCWECLEEIVEVGKTRGCLTVHHLDGNHDNDSSDNLVGVHRACHATLHLRGNTRTKGKPLTSGHKEAISESLRGKPKSEEMKRRNSESHRGKALSKEHCEALQESWRKRIIERNG